MVQFLNKRLFIFDGYRKIDYLQQKFKINYLLLTGNPHESIKEINDSFEDYTLIVDGNNSDRLINQMKQQATSAHINYSILKRNKSYISASN